MSGTLPKKFAEQFELALHNFTLAKLICAYLIDQHKRGFAPIPTEVWMKGNGSKVHIPGENCGFFTTPIIHNAMLDVRRSLEFMLLRFEKKTGTLIAKEPRKEDFSILDLGIKAPTPEQLYELSMKVTGKAPCGFLFELVQATNKQLAHFSKDGDYSNFNSIIDSTTLIKEALLVFVYDAMKLPRPKIQPGTIE